MSGTVADNAALIWAAMTGATVPQLEALMRSQGKRNPAAGGARGASARMTETHLSESLPKPTDRGERHSTKGLAETHGER